MREHGRVGMLTSNINFQVPKLVRVSDYSATAQLFSRLISSQTCYPKSPCGSEILWPIKRKKLVQSPLSSYFQRKATCNFSISLPYLCTLLCNSDRLHCKRHKGEILGAGNAAPFVLISTQIDQQEIDWKLFIDSCTKIPSWLHAKGKNNFYRGPIKQLF